MRVDLLRVEASNWRGAVPEIRTWAEMGIFVAETSPSGLLAVVTGGPGGYTPRLASSTCVCGSIEIPLIVILGIAILLSFHSSKEENGSGLDINRSQVRLYKVSYLG
jgi:hypothetical protein